MTDLMLIDAAHPEELRVVVLRDDKVEEFDYESSLKKPLKGNIYLAKVTRVEPSLQAAFVDFGGNRHGFLAFSEIHPDYFQIPISDRDGLSANDEDSANEAVSAEEAAKNSASTTLIAKADNKEEADGDNKADIAAKSSDSDANDGSSENIVEVNDEDFPSDDKHVENIGESDEAKEYKEIEDEKDKISKRINKKYKIQEVIKKNQILLIQVVKEERGNKGAALTTYLSLAGRYCVLMPNTNRGGGISRKITDPQVRKNVKKIAEELTVPEGMGIILRTAGANRNKLEIKRDYEYLMRLWENIRDLTLKSIAPCVVYEEGNLIKKSIRDLYNKHVNKVIIHGSEGYLEAKEFMKMLLPSHVKNIKKYTDPVPLFIKYNIERQVDNLFSPIVQLESGGYLVMHQTEALVSIDVNSGKATKNFSIEETALQTNLEATKEVSRHLRLRDMSGLVVIDFIDMEDRSNRRAVEKAMKDCLRKDRARIQMGRISVFGLMEMSRQRLRASVLEGTTDICSNCMGAGHVKSTELTALHILREVELSLLNQVKRNVVIYASPSNTMFILNHKRQYLIDLEERLKIRVRIETSNHLLSNAYIIKHDSDDGDISTHLRDAAIQLGASSDNIKSSTSSSTDIIASNGLVHTKKNFKGSRYSSKDKRGRGRGAINRRNVNKKRRYETDEDIDNSKTIDANNTDSNLAQSSKGKATKPYNKRSIHGRSRKRITDKPTHNNDNIQKKNDAVRNLSEEEMKIYHQDISQLSSMNNVSKDQDNAVGNDVTKDSSNKPNENPKSGRKPRVRKSDTYAAKEKINAGVQKSSDDKPIAQKPSNGTDKELASGSSKKMKEPVMVDNINKKEDEKKKSTRKGWWSRTNFF